MAWLGLALSQVEVPSCPGEEEGKKSNNLCIRDEWEPRTARERCIFRSLAPLFDSTRYVGDYIGLGCDLCCDF